jgi:predicted phosphate transport protein (TIGR00153 family)
LESFVATGEAEAGRRVMRLEKDADETRRILMDELNRTFVTPIDREDIFALSRAIDDVLDYAHTTVREMMTLEIGSNEHVRHMVSVLKEGTEELNLAVLRLQRNPNVAMEHANRAKRLENQMEEMYREAIAVLFRGAVERNDVEGVIEIMKMREVYRHLSNAADRADEAADVIGDIVVKTT